MVEPQNITAGGILTYKLTVENGGSAIATGVTVIDPIPSGTSYVAGSATATAPNATYDATNGKVLWNGDVPVGGAVTITFQAQVKDEIDCGVTIHNRAVISHSSSNTEMVAEADAKVICSEPTGAMDFGDAPDSRSNHHGKSNIAYPSVQGQFPTVWEGTPAGESSGPAHASLVDFWLGSEISGEKDADLLPDSDGVTNILANGTADVADQDKGDDGWLNPTVPIENCRETMFHVRVSRGAIANQVERLYLNVWFDGNRDGLGRRWRLSQQR
ncbi:MAG: DUF11 domain-containing protein [Caldilineaceae bacterium]